jgi:hypothetical protein
MNWSQVIERMEGEVVKWLLIAAFIMDIAVAGKWRRNLIE